MSLVLKKPLYYVLFVFKKKKNSEVVRLLKFVTVHNYRKLSLEVVLDDHGNPLQYSCLENYMDRGTWWATVHGMAKS